MSNENSVTTEPMAGAFAGAMQKLTYVGLAVMLVPGVLYLFGLHPFLDVHTVAAHWGEPSSVFWEGAKGMTIHGYSWFLSNLAYLDMLCIGGVALLGLVPLFSILSALLKAEKGPYRILLLILLLEFAFAIVKPLVMAGGGE